MKRLAIFASGSGSNAQNIIDYFSNNKKAEVVLILSNKPTAYVIERAKSADVPYKVFNRDEFYQSLQILEWMREYRIDFIVLAGFLWLVPDYLVEAFPNRIVNIHPALLPKYGGKGMFGGHVHEAVIAHNETETGITIHYVNKRYDEGNIVFQASCPVLPGDTADDVASRVHQLEYEHFPKIIDKLLAELD